MVWHYFDVLEVEGTSLSSLYDSTQTKLSPLFYKILRIC